jgi:hypothetical protein
LLDRQRGAGQGRSISALEALLPRAGREGCGAGARNKAASEFVGFREDLMRVKRLQAFIVLLMLALACLRAHAQPAMPVNPPLPDRELVIATREVPPFVMKRKDGSWHGISIALWHRIAERLHVRYRFAEQKTN